MFGGYINLSSYGVLSSFLGIELPELYHITMIQSPEFHNNAISKIGNKNQELSERQAVYHEILVCINQVFPNELSIEAIDLLWYAMPLFDQLLSDHILDNDNDNDDNSDNVCKDLDFLIHSNAQRIINQIALTLNIPYKTSYLPKMCDEMCMWFVALSGNSTYNCYRNHLKLKLNIFDLNSSLAGLRSSNRNILDDELNLIDFIGVMNQPLEQSPLVPQQQQQQQQQGSLRLSLDLIPISINDDINLDIIDGISDITSPQMLTPRDQSSTLTNTPNRPIKTNKRVTLTTDRLNRNEYSIGNMPNKLRRIGSDSELVKKTKGATARVRFAEDLEINSESSNMIPHLQLTSTLSTSSSSSSSTSSSTSTLFIEGFKLNRNNKGKENHHHQPHYISSLQTQSLTLRKRSRDEPVFFEGQCEYD